MFLSKCRRFRDRKNLDLRGTRTLLSYPGRTFAVLGIWILAGNIDIFLSKIVTSIIKCCDLDVTLTQCWENGYTHLNLKTLDVCQNVKIKHWASLRIGLLAKDVLLRKKNRKRYICINLFRGSVYTTSEILHYIPRNMRTRFALCFATRGLRY